ncbi:Hypothetical predicted protein [Olea europaea subsp. europaea]|uniref:Uncharacterized protein n=1 Tax=Olea europaea subsp. europaea TaxID=158383 RepID=A0A8S0QHG6_OLEEU|nr:Hypothetical predicted protein [Olea europaea subsp. europaea]
MLESGDLDAMPQLHEATLCLRCHCSYPLIEAQLLSEKREEVDDILCARQRFLTSFGYEKSKALYRWNGGFIATVATLTPQRWLHRHNALTE